MQRIRLIATDLDGTFLRGAMEMDERNLAAVRRAREAGIIVRPCTGRFWGSAHYIAQEGGFFDDIMVTNNGAGVVRIRSGEALTEWNIPQEELKKVLEICEEKHANMKLYAQRYMAIAQQEIEEEELLSFQRNKDRPEGAQYQLHIYETKEALFEECKGDAQQVVMRIHPEEYSAFREYFQRELPGYEITSSFPWMMELMAPGVNKATGLKWVAEHYGIPQEQVMAIGNGKNDRCMIEYAGIGVAVGDSDPELLEAADVIVSNHQEAGFAEAVERYALRGR